MENVKFYQGRRFEFNHIFGLFVYPILLTLNLLRDLDKPGDHHVALALDIGLIIFYLVATIYFLVDMYRKNKSTKVKLELTQKEINYNAGERIIPWKDIDSLKYKSEAIAIILNDNESFKAKTTWGRIGQWLNKLFYGTPVIINLAYLRGDAFENYNIIYDYMGEVKKLRNNEHLSIMI
ncbi:hypothetical protein [Mucilaginibacter psychrotolerans]|uniref:Uncharacterized protein n=1 Tax=Mucilaginibacter psychrotolerans TaxID=1524096 RepID=A0A4Y8SQZ3_9SPHI|nr:hypothetical protein [Mucilaginibacter psychrotolerans]TFF40960.1 hypothetical protein E2R66_01935 [Mucilaginibacter psychrotolerans]